MIVSGCYYFYLGKGDCIMMRWVYSASVRRQSVSFLKSSYFVFILFTFCSTALLYTVANFHGWPIGHDLNFFFYRIVIYAQHMKSGDFFPAWSSIDNYGFGSPWPSVYGRLFYIIAGACFLITHSLKTATLLGIFCCFLIGAYGMYSLCLRLRCHRYFAIGAGLMLIGANYTTTDWLIRSDMAELSGAMLVPWVLSWFIDAIENEKFHPMFGFTLGLTVLAHLIIAYYVCLMAIIVIFSLIIARKISYNIIMLRSIYKSLLTFSLTTLPNFFCLYMYSANYNLHQFIQYFRPEYSRHHFHEYFYNPNFHWGKHAGAYSVQLDFIILLLLFIPLFIFLYRLKTKKTSFYLKPIVKKNLIALSIIIGFCFFLQTRQGVPIYNIIPMANFIQFPWRLLAIITPACIAFSFLLIEVLAKKSLKIVALIAALVMYVTSGAFARIHYQAVGPMSKDIYLTESKNLKTYVPVSQKIFSISSYKQVIEKIVKQHCSINTLHPLAEGLHREFNVHCQHSSVVSLPVFQDKGFTVTVNNHKGQRCLTNEESPALCGVSLKAGDNKVIIHYPTFFTLVSSLFA